MNTSSVLSASLLLDFNDMGVPKNLYDETMSSVSKKLEELSSFFDESSSNADNLSILMFIMTKIFIRNPDLKSSDVKTYFENHKFLNQATSSVDVNECIVSSLLSSSLAFDNFIFSLFIVDRVSEEEYAKIKHFLTEKFQKFYAEISVLLSETSGKLSSFVIINMANSIIHSNSQSMINLLSGTSDILDVFVDNPEPMIDKIFNNISSQIRATIYAAIELLGNS